MRNKKLKRPSDVEACGVWGARPSADSGVSSSSKPDPKAAVASDAEYSSEMD